MVMNIINVYKCNWNYWSLHRLITSSLSASIIISLYSRLPTNSLFKQRHQTFSISLSCFPTPVVWLMAADLSSNSWNSLSQILMINKSTKMTWPPWDGSTITQNISQLWPLWEREMCRCWEREREWMGAFGDHAMHLNCGRGEQIQLVCFLSLCLSKSILPCRGRKMDHICYCNAFFGQENTVMLCNSETSNVTCVHTSL